ncbi:unnamed protein product [Nesidiocoris tenuis]|uniref:Uncharacterized protein n=1 Tax=Nesidiocoris tenuis TaxID=355587 RepID=A0A6H5GA11_9HEMI|nr:unnamed protein product [Nesidiocoris tenuis]
MAGDAATGGSSRPPLPATRLPPFTSATPLRGVQWLRYPGALCFWIQLQQEPVSIQQLAPSMILSVFLRVNEGAARGGKAPPYAPPVDPQLKRRPPDGITMSKIVHLYSDKLKEYLFVQLVK